MAKVVIEMNSKSPKVEVGATAKLETKLEMNLSWENVTQTVEIDGEDGNKTQKVLYQLAAICECLTPSQHSNV